ncbi:MAG: thiamine-phosphate kinase [Calditrichaeota bacterium]|nr:thiamine-phosphate kinase [Calditrichota bacterium]
MKHLHDLGEFGLIELLTRKIRPSEAVKVGIGDDAAVVSLPQEHLLLSTVDSQIEGTHFDWPLTTPQNLGRKLAAVNLSDLAAMGGTPRFALLDLALPPDFPIRQAQEFFAGLETELRHFSAEIVGGNTSASSHFAAGLTLFGHILPQHLKKRSGARPGDLICVTGSLGKGAAGLTLAKQSLSLKQKNRRVLEFWQTPRARVEAGQILGAIPNVHAMIDISDGLAGDLGHLCKASGVGARIDEETLPVDDSVREWAKISRHSVLDWILYGGEDYELLFTLPEEAFSEVRSKLRPAVNATIIGRILDKPGELYLQKQNGKRIKIEPTAWNHF